MSDADRAPVSSESDRTEPADNDDPPSLDPSHRFLNYRCEHCGILAAQPKAREACREKVSGGSGEARTAPSPPERDPNWGTMFGPFAIIRTIGGKCLLVDDGDDGAPVAEFVNEKEAHDFGIWVARLEAKSIRTAPSPTTPSEQDRRVVLDG